MSKYVFLCSNLNLGNLPFVLVVCSTACNNVYLNSLAYFHIYPIWDNDKEAIHYKHIHRNNFFFTSSRLPTALTCTT